MGSSLSSSNCNLSAKIEECKEGSSSSSNLIFSKKSDCQFKRIKKGKYEATIDNIDLYIENIVSRFDLVVEKIEINSYKLEFINVNQDLHWALDVYYKSGSRFKIDYDDQGPRYDIVDEAKNLIDTRSIIKNIYQHKFFNILATDQMFLENMHKITFLHLELNPTYNFYCNNCRYYSLMVFDYFLLHQYLCELDDMMIKEFMTHTREVHKKFNRFLIPLKITSEADFQLARMKEISQLATEAFMKQYKIEEKN